MMKDTTPQPNHSTCHLNNLTVVLLFYAFPPNNLPIPVLKLPAPPPFPLTELAFDELPPPPPSHTPNTFFTGIASVRLTLTGVTSGGNIAAVVAVRYNIKYFKFANVDRKSITCNTCEFINYPLTSPPQNRWVTCSISLFSRNTA